ncbi:hypothetical protein GE09DRAFT_1243184 [Coniochaeta sp. 2T2.1]|nr:hypothetical protein GE09DRAFT_1243184 [Coniochaeta sp. 2T2.1]
MHYSKPLLSLAYASLASAAALTPRQTQQPTIQCDGARFPNLNDCDVLADVLGWPSGIGTTSPPEGQQCRKAWALNHDINCEVLMCNRVDGAPPMPNSLAYENYNAIRTTCMISQQAGGASNSADGLYQIQAWNDPLFNPAAAGLRTGNAIQVGFNGTSIEEELRKRQQPGDNSATLSVVTRNVAAPNSRQQVTGRLPAGSSYTTTQGDERSTGISSSFGLEAGFFDLFTASAGITVETSYTVTSSVGITVVIQCDNGQQGILYWSPLFNRYQGNFQPSGDAYDVWIPLADSAGSYDVECLG